MQFSTPNLMLLSLVSAYAALIIILHILFYQRYRICGFDKNAACAVVTTYAVLYKPHKTV